LEFRIKEQGQSDWYYRAEYKVDQFQNSKSFPFGFPIINESENRTYLIEIESQRGIPGDVVAQSGASPRIIGKHVYGKKLLFSGPQPLIRFAVQKAVNLIQFQEFFSSFALFAMPLVIYIFFLVTGSGVGLFSSVLLDLTIADIFWIQHFYPYFQLSTVFGWFLVMRKHRFTYMVPALIGMSLFFLAPVAYFFRLETMANKIGIWTFWFFCLAVFQMGCEVFTRLGQTMNLHQYLRNLLVEVRNTFLIAWYMAIGQVTLMAETTKINIHERLAITVERFGVPMISSYLIVSRFVSLLIRLLITSINYAFRFGPYLVSAWLIRLSFVRLSGYANFFQAFFITDQSDRFWNSVGYYLIAVHLLAVVIFLTIQRKKALRVKTYYLIAVLLITFNLSRAVFDLATASYREKPTIWLTKPEQTTEPWTDVSIVGRNFGEKPFGGKVYIDRIEQRVIDWKANEIIFRTNPMVTRTGDLSIKTRREEPSNTIMFIYTGNR